MVNSLIGSVLAAQVDEVLVTSSLCHLCKLVHRMAAKSVKLNLVFFVSILQSINTYAFSALIIFVRIKSFNSCLV